MNIALLFSIVYRGGGINSKNREKIVPGIGKFLGKNEVIKLYFWEV